MSKLAKIQASHRLKRVAIARDHTIGVTLAGLALGYYERTKGSVPRLIDSVPIPAKAQLALVLAVVSDRLSGKAREYTKTASDGLAAIAAYEQGKAGFGEIVKGR